MEPSKGRIVMYQSDRMDQSFPGIIIHVHSETVVDLNVFTYSGVILKMKVLQGTGSGLWDWPERK